MHRANYTISEQVFGKQTFAYTVCMYTYPHTCCVSMVFQFSWEYYYYQRLLTELISRARRELPIYDDCGCCICFCCCCFGFANDRFCLSVQFSLYIHIYIQIYICVFFSSLLLEQILNACEIVKNKYVTLVCTIFLSAFPPTFLWPQTEINLTLSARQRCCLYTCA